MTMIIQSHRPIITLAQTAGWVGAVLALAALVREFQEEIGAHVERLVAFLRSYPILDYQSGILMDGLTLAILVWGFRQARHYRRRGALLLLGPILLISLALLQSVTPPPGPDMSVLDFLACLWVAALALFLARPTRAPYAQAPGEVWAVLDEIDPNLRAQVRARLLERARRRRA